MAYISGANGGTIVRGPTTTSSNVTTTSSSNTISVTGLDMSGTPFTDWHKTLLWFLGGVALVALAAPAPNVSTMLLVVIIVGVVMGNWNDYKMFLGLK